MASPVLSPSTCTSMWRMPDSASSRNTASSPNADSASRRAASTAPGRSSACSTRRMPRPPPPETAFTNSGKPISAPQADGVVRCADSAGDCARTGTPAASAAPRAATFEAASSSTSGVGADEGQRRLRTRPGQRGALREEAVARDARRRPRTPGPPPQSSRCPGRAAADAPAPRSRTPRRPWSGAGCRCRPACAPPQWRSPARWRPGRRGWLSRRGWRRAACGSAVRAQPSALRPYPHATVPIGQCRRSEGCS